MKARAKARHAEQGKEHNMPPPPPPLLLLLLPPQLLLLLLLGHNGTQQDTTGHNGTQRREGITSPIQQRKPPSWDRNLRHTGGQPSPKMAYDAPVCPEGRGPAKGSYKSFKHRPADTEGRHCPSSNASQGRGNQVAPSTQRLLSRTGLRGCRRHTNTNDNKTATS